MSGSQVILHLGLGSFHRAHQAVYLHQLRELGDRRWSLMGGNIRPDMETVQQTLHHQDGAYTLETISPAGVHDYLRVTSIEKVIAWDERLSGLIQAAADPHTKIISFTVTEAGYYLDASNTLDTSSLDVQSDLAKALAGLAGHTIYGALTALLRARIQSGAGPLTLLNCDNLRHNGDRSRSGLLQFVAKLSDPILLDWIEHHTSSPNAMVDRITPRPTAEVVERVAKATGVRDPAALMGESFIQWVIEDRFIAGRPDWARVGVELVDSVDAYEEAKIRLLNATHSCIAWAGSLVGYQFIHEGTRDAEIRQFAYNYVTDDVIPVLDRADKPCPIDLAAYRDVVLARFGNPAIQDTNQRVAMDGFSKIPGFIVPTIRERLAQGASISSVAMLPALFLAYLQRWHTGQIAYTYQDQAMDASLAHGLFATTDTVAAFCAVPALWGDLINHPSLVAAIRHADLRVQHFMEQRP